MRRERLVISILAKLMRSVINAETPPKRGLVVLPDDVGQSVS